MCRICFILWFRSKLHELLLHADLHRLESAVRTRHKLLQVLIACKVRVGRFKVNWRFCSIEYVRLLSARPILCSYILHSLKPRTPIEGVLLLPEFVYISSTTGKCTLSFVELFLWRFEGFLVSFKDCLSKLHRSLGVQNAHNCTVRSLLKQVHILLNGLLRLSNTPGSFAIEESSHTSWTKAWRACICDDWRIVYLDRKFCLFGTQLCLRALQTWYWLLCFLKGKWRGSLITFHCRCNWLGIDC